MSVTINNLPIGNPLTGSEVLPIVQGNETVKTTVQEIANLAGLAGTNYVYVAANGTDVENAAELQAAYTTAQGMSPSATNRITIIAAPGNYNFSSGDFIMNTEYIDLVSLDGNRSVIFNGTRTISITANDVFVKGVDVRTKNFTIANSLNLLKVENCKGGNDSFGGGRIASGTFTNCTGGRFSFGSFGTASGTFTNCTGGNESFGGENGTASGTFTNCTGGNEAFGGSSFGTASGTFTNCTGGDQSFGVSTASGTFTNCTGGNQSFGGLNNLSGKLYYCRLTTGTFNSVSGGGKTRYCLDGNNNTNNQG